MVHTLVSLRPKNPLLTSCLPWKLKMLLQGIEVQPARWCACEPETREGQQTTSSLLSLGSFSWTTSAECAKSVN